YDPGAGRCLSRGDDRASAAVTNEDSAIPWLLGAEAVIHNGCTTGRGGPSVRSAGDPLSARDARAAGSRLTERRQRRRGDRGRACRLVRIRCHATTDPLPAPTAAEHRAARREAWRRSLSKRLNALVSGHKNSAAYTRRRFPDTDLSEVTARIDRLGTIL